jgi:flagellar motor switch protein FliG
MIFKHGVHKRQPRHQLLAGIGNEHPSTAHMIFKHGVHKRQPCHQLLAGIGNEHPPTAHMIFKHGVHKVISYVIFKQKKDKA